MIKAQSFVFEIISNDLNQCYILRDAKGSPQYFFTNVKDFTNFLLDNTGSTSLFEQEEKDN